MIYWNKDHWVIEGEYFYPDSLPLRVSKDGRSIRRGSVTYRADPAP